ncbi:MAG: PKD domain-containing protein [Paludibacter sp.]|nr:PKD domain-containing protein [Paludibacter sp.]
MKKIKSLLPIGLLMIFTFAGCIVNEPLIEDFPSDKVSFKYEVVGDYGIDYLVGSPIQFTNVSEAVGNVSWDFGDGSPVSVEANPKHTYQTAGTYDVKLTVEGEGTTTKRILISDIFPTITIGDIPNGICEVKTTAVELNVELPNPQNLEVEYTWIFPLGTVNEAGEMVQFSSQANPGKIKFLNVGSQKVRLQTKLGGRFLQEGVVNVQVAYNQPAKTLYYAVKGGNIMAVKLVKDAPADITILPYDLGVKSGQHSFNILFNDSSLYVLDAGKQYYYVNDVDMNLGDGSISVISKDGKKVETMLTNNGGYAFNDPYYGYIDPTTRTLYFSDRNTGISTISLDTRNVSMDGGKEPGDRKTFPYWVQNATLGYYGNGYVYGAMNSNFMKVGDTWWWSKTFAGAGIFRFKDSDILKTPTAGGLPQPASGMVLPGMFAKSFVVDQTRGFVYFTIYDAAVAGFYKVPLSEMASIKEFSNLNVAGRKIAELVPDTEGSSGEYVSVSQMVLDPEDGAVYFGYRTGDAAKMKSGLKRYNPTTNKVESVVDNVEIYGVTINNTKSKLF